MTDEPEATPDERGLAALSERRFAAVLFDMDGTLVDSTPAVERAWRVLAEEEGIDPAQLRGFHGVPARGILEQVLPEERHEAAMARIVELEVADTDGVVPLPGAEDALSALAGSERPLSAIVTSCTRELAAVRIQASGLTAPALVVTADDVTRGKPDPAPFLLAAERLGVDPARCLVVEDAPAGLAAARAAGCATLAVLTTTAPEELHADAVVQRLDAVRFVVATDPADPQGLEVWVGLG